MGVHNITTGQEIEPTFEPQEPPGGGDGGNMDGMETRVTLLETRLGGVETRLGDVDARLGRVEVKLDHLGDEVKNLKWLMLGGVITIIVTTMATVIATGVGIQQMTVTTFEAAAKANPSGTAQILVLPAQVLTPQTAPAPAPAPSK